MSTHWPRLVAPAILIVLAAVGCGGQPGSASSQRLNLITPSVPAGADVSGSIQAGNLERTYLLHLPPASTRITPTPVVLAVHGWPLRGAYVRSGTHSPGVADAY